MLVPVKIETSSPDNLQSTEGDINRIGAAFETPHQLPQQWFSVTSRRLDGLRIFKGGPLASRAASA